MVEVVDNGDSTTAKSKMFSPSEYNTIEETIAPVALETITDWIVSVLEDAS